MKKVLSFIFLLSAYQPACTQGMASRVAYEWYKKGLKEPDFAMQIEYYTKAIAKNPSYALAYNNRGLAKVQLGKYEEALEDANEAVRLDPKNSDAFNTRALAKYGLLKYDEALQDANEAIRLNPKNGWAYNTRGLAKYGLLEYEEAILDANEAIRLNPKDAWGYYTRGIAKDVLGKHEEALMDFNEAVRFDAKNGWAYYGRELAKYGLGKYEEAIQDANEAIRLNPKNGWAYYYQVFAKYQLGKFAEAVQDADEMIRVDPKNSWGHYARGNVNYTLGKYEEAIRDETEAIKLDPKNGYAYKVRGHAQEAAKRYEEALQDYGEASSRNIAGSKESKDALEKLQRQVVSSDQAPSANHKLLKKVALVIGVKSYTSVAPLANTLNDAMDVSASLRAKGFEVIELLDPKTKSDMRNAAIKFSKMLEDQPDGVGMLYYSGHGMQLDGVNYLIPAAAMLDIKADVEEQCMNMDYFLRAMEANGNHLNIVVLDACRNNPFRSFSRSAEKGLSMVSAPKGSYIVYATKPGSVASDGNGRNGLFTSKLLKFLSEPNLNIEQVFKKVAAEVARDSNDAQRPWISSDYTGDFYFTNN